MMLSRTFRGCLPALLLWAGALAAESPQATLPVAVTAAAPAVSPAISYTDGQLKIDAQDTTLSELLTKISALTGVKIELPPGASGERMPLVQLGPGSAREVLASLLGDSSFDYLIQASDADPAKIQAVIVMARDKKGHGSSVLEANSRRPRSPYSRASAAASSEEAPAADIPAPQPEPVVAEASAPPDQPAPTPPDQPVAPVSTQPGGMVGQPPGVVGPSPGAMAPPQDLSPKSMNQQLQQMYQQRIQINQAAQAAQAAAQGGK